MNDRILLPVAVLIAFLASWEFFGPDASGESTLPDPPNSLQELGSSGGASRPASEDIRGRRHARQTAPSSVRIPPELLSKLQLVVINPETGNFTPELMDLLAPEGTESPELRQLFDRFFEALASAEKSVARTFDFSPESGERTRGVEIPPTGHLLENEYRKLQEEAIALLGREKGLLFSTIVQRQFGRTDGPPERITFKRRDNNYSLMIKNSPLAGSWGGRAIYPAPDLARVARYRHLAEFLRR